MPCEITVMELNTLLNKKLSCWWTKMPCEITVMDLKDTVEQTVELPVIWDMQIEARMWGCVNTNVKYRPENPLGS